jgi:hypothetical protein
MNETELLAEVNWGMAYVGAVILLCGIVGLVLRISDLVRERRK